MQERSRVKAMNHLHNSTLTIYSDRLRRNVSSVYSGLEPGCSVIAVLKCDAYGLGLVPCARILEDMPQVGMFAVAHAAEGIALRAAGIGKGILVMAPSLPGQWKTAVEAGLTLTVGNLGIIPALAGLGMPVHIQIKLETGLNRTGFTAPELPVLVDELRSAGSAVIVDGAYSHFSSGCDSTLCRLQYEAFISGTEYLRQAGITIPMRHISASESSENFPEYNLDAVRLGRRLFMDNPVPRGNIDEVMELKTHILDIRSRSAGDIIGYGGTLTAGNGCIIADIGVGYGDGLPTALAKHGGTVLIGGKRCSIVYICMDQTLVDVTDVECAVGDIVTIFGTDEHGNTLTSQAQALVYGGNEGCSITAALSPRVYREYI